MTEHSERVPTKAEMQSFPGRANANLESNPRKHSRCLDWAENACRKGLEYSVVDPVKCK